MNIFKKKTKPQTPYLIDRGLAHQGITKVVMKYAEALRKEPDMLSFFLYVARKDTDMALFQLCPTAFARMHGRKKGNLGFSLYLTEKSLGEYYDRFVKAGVSGAFSREDGVVDNPGSPAEKGPYHIIDFGYDAEAASAVITGLVKEVFGLEMDNVCFLFQLFDLDDEAGCRESTARFDTEGNKTEMSGFEQDLF